jgi:molybdopterin molybdotransferase
MSAASMRALSVEEARERILAGAASSGRAVTRELLEAAGHVLAAPLAARLAQPPFDASAMDGYAVRATDVARLPATLQVIGTSAAGHGFAGRLGPGDAVRIFTGAPVPAGADAVVIQENTRRDGEQVTVTEGRPDPEHVRPRGGDFAEGEVLIPSDRRLTARDLTLAAAMGHGVLTVRQPPVVAILATGDELVSPGTTPGENQIVCSSSFGLAALVSAAGGEPRLLGIARDTAADLGAHIDRAAGADILVTVGGASVGDYDLVAPVLTARGMALDFWKIAMRPGKPVMFGRLGEQRVLVLPGNPVSSLVCSRLFLVPLIRALLGLVPEPQQPVMAVAAVPLAANGPRAHYMRARSRIGTDGRRQVTPVPSQDSSLMRPLADADCLIVRPIGAAAAPAGAHVPVLMLDF